MKCPKCPSFKNRVLETRAWTSAIWRRRRCLDCLREFWTYESPQPLTHPAEYIRAHSLTFRKLEKI